MSAVTICSDSGAPQNKFSYYFHCFPMYLSWSNGTRCYDLSFLNVEKQKAEGTEKPTTLWIHMRGESTKQTTTSKFDRQENQEKWPVGTSACTITYSENLRVQGIPVRGVGGGPIISWDLPPEARQGSHSKHQRRISSGFRQEKEPLWNSQNTLFKKACLVN